MRLIKLLGSNLEVTPAIRSYVEERLQYSAEKFTKNFDAEGTELSVEVSRTSNHHKNGDVHRCEVMLSVPGGQNFRAEATKDDLYAAIDAVRDDLMRQIKEQEKKTRSKDRRGGALLKKLRGYIPFLGANEEEPEDLERKP
ncbi:MAG: ribosome-associated translation inhibitor RaiA [bacterium]